MPRPGAAIGFCQDPDADRLAIIDEQGRYLGEEYTLAICVEHVLPARRGPVVTNCSTSRMTEDVARKYGVPFFRSAVGEANVVDEMLGLRRRAGRRGERRRDRPARRAGARQFRRHGPGARRDGGPRDARQANWPTSCPATPSARRSSNCDRDRFRPRSMPSSATFNDAASDRLDGLRLDWTNADGTGRWLLVRASNTEPIVRLVAEAATADEAQRLCDKAAEAMRQAN